MVTSMNNDSNNLTDEPKKKRGRPVGSGKVKGYEDKKLNAVDRPINVKEESKKVQPKKIINSSKPGVSRSIEEIEGVDENKNLIEEISDNIISENTITEGVNRFRVEPDEKENDKEKSNRNTLRCFYCDEEINKATKLYWVGIDRPVYINVPFHLSCHLLIRRDFLDEREYFKEEKTYNRLLKIVQDSNESSGKQKSKILSKGKR